MDDQEIKFYSLHRSDSVQFFPLLPFFPPYVYIFYIKMGKKGGSFIPVKCFLERQLFLLHSFIIFNKFLIPGDKSFILKIL